MRAERDGATPCRACGPGEDFGFSPSEMGAMDNSEHRRDMS